LTVPPFSDVAKTQLLFPALPGFVWVPDGAEIGCTRGEIRAGRRLGRGVGVSDMLGGCLMNQSPSTTHS
jgi:hypothetical protein